MNKLPVGETIGFAYRFTFNQLGTIIGLIWIPLVVIAVLQFLPYGLGDSTLSPEDNPAAYGGAQLRAIVFLFVIILMYACLFVSVTQQALGVRQGDGIFHFTLGRTELRMWGALLLLAAIATTLLLAVALLATVGVVVTAKSVNNGLAGPVEDALLFVGACAFLFAMVRVGFLLAPATIVEKKIAFKSSWKLSHGNFWRISLALFVVTLPVTIVVLAAQFGLMGRELVSVMQPERGLSLETVMTRMELVTSRHIAEIIGINLIVAPFLYGLVLATAAFAYRTLSAGTAGTSPPEVQAPLQS